MRLEQLYAFKKIAETGSIRKVSAALFSTPQNISQAMIQLEKEWNTTLYTRSRTGVKLTEAGEHAYQLIQRILEDIDELNRYFHVEESFRGDDRRQPVFIRSCAVMEPFASGTVSLLAEEYAQTPIQIDIKGNIQSREYFRHLERYTNEDMPDLVVTNEIPDKLDLLREQSAKYYSCYLLFEDELCLQVPKNDPLSKYEKIPLKLLETLPMLLFTGTPTEKTESEQILEKWGYTMKNVSRTSNLETCSRLAVNQHKYCFVGYPSVEFRPMANVDYIPLERQILTNQMLMVKRKRRNKTFTDAFIHSFDDYFNLKKMW